MTLLEMSDERVIHSHAQVAIMIVVRTGRAQSEA
jgi:hypothetical protein